MWFRAVIERLETRVFLSVDVLSNHNDGGSTGQNLAETVLTPASVGSTNAAGSISTNFGRQFSTALDGQVYAQPLEVSNVNITRGSFQGIHNVLYVATMHDSLYAIDANSGVILWQDSFLQIADPRVSTIGSPAPTAGVSTFPAVSGNNALVNGNDIGPELGILATPTIDRASNTLYVVADTQEYRNGSTPTATFVLNTSDIHYVQRLWAINLGSGAVAITPNNIAAEPTSGGQVFGDTILNPRSGTVPTFNSYNQSSSAVSSLTRSGTTATATIGSTTNMRIGDSITISGASPAGYNGTFAITNVPSSTTVQFTVANTLATPATGTITLKFGANYKYVVGPSVKGTGNNTDTFNPDGTVATTDNADGWGVNLADSTSIFAGTTPSRTGYIAFNALLQMNRVATTLVNGEIYLGFASHGDAGPYYGWLLGFNAATLANNAAFVTVPTFDGIKGSAGFTSVGGLWGAGATIASDGTNLYFTVGNGSFNTSPSNFNANYFSIDSGNHVLQPLDGDYGNSVLKLTFDASATQANVNLANAAAGNPTPSGAYQPEQGYNLNGFGLKVVDFFTPSNAKVLNLHDEDVGSGGVMLIPSTGPGAATAPNGHQMLVTGGKEGRIYLIDAGDMGGFNTQYAIDGREIDSTTNPLVDPAPYDRVLGEYYYRQANGSPGTYANDQTNKIYSIPGYFNGKFYMAMGAGSTTSLTSPEQGFTVATFPFSASPHTGVQPTPSFVTTNKFGGRGSTPSFSANGLANGIIWNNNVNHSGTTATLTSAISSGATVTTLPVSPLQIALSSGNTITLIAVNGSRQTVTVAGTAAANATSIPVQSFVANAAYATGTFVNGPNQPGDHLVAYDSAGNMLFSSNWTISGEANSISNSLTNGVAGATGAKFSIPTVANGMVYTGTGAGSGTAGSAHQLGSVVGYGLLGPYLSSNAGFFGAPTGLVASSLSATTAHLSWVRNSTLETQMRVDRSTDGTNWTTLQYLPNGTTSYDDTTVVAGTQYFYRVTAVSGASVTAFSQCGFYISTSGSHTYNLRLDAGGTNLQIFIDVQGFSSPTFTLSAGMLDSLFDGVGSGAAGSMTVDLTNGNPVPAGGVSFVGTTFAGAGDSLFLTGSANAETLTINTNTLTVSGNPITFTNVDNVTLNTGGGNDTLAQTATPTAFVTFNGGANSDTLNINGGTFTYRTDPQLNTASLTINNNAALVFDAPLNGQGLVTRSVTALNLGAGSTTTLGTNAIHSNRIVLVLGALSFGGSTNAWQGKLDLGGNDMIVHNGSLANLTNQIKAGLNLASGYWNGSTGIASAFAAADVAHLTALAVLLNDNGQGQPIYGTGTIYGTFDNNNVVASDVLIKYTWYGDTDLNGRINGGDYAKTDNGFNASLTGWSNGDFNYTSSIDGGDYSTIDNAFNSQGAVVLAEPAAGAAAPGVTSTAGMSSASKMPPAPLQQFAPGGGSHSQLANVFSSLNRLILPDEDVSWCFDGRQRRDDTASPSRFELD